LAVLILPRRVYQLWYDDCVSEPGDSQPVLKVVFYSTASGNEPVRAWLLDLSREDRRAVGFDIKTAQYGWPVGMPLIRKLEPGLWEVRSYVRDGIGRVVFTVENHVMVLLHGFVKKSQKTSASDLRIARERLADFRKG
jgi:phage-related protein